MGSSEWRVEYRVESEECVEMECEDCVERGKGFWEKCVECVVKYPSSLLPIHPYTQLGVDRLQVGQG